jgi:ATP-dependent exoDNAse (exonuclease V) alpha subunit
VAIRLVTSHAPMLGKTLLYTAMTCARRLLVIAGQKKALYLAVRDWRQAPRHTASVDYSMVPCGSSGGRAAT